MNRKFGVIAGIIIIAATIVGGTIGGATTRLRNVSAKVHTTTAANILGDYGEAITTILPDNYAGEIDYEKATQASIQGMLQTLDPHSMFFSRTEYTKLKEDQDSRFYGIGVT